MKKILVVVTNTSIYPNRIKTTGVWFQEVVHFVDKLIHAGYEVDYVSPKGGYTPIDPGCLTKEQMTELDWKYYTDQAFLNKLGTTLSPENINPNEYEAIYYAGGHGVMWDFADNEELQTIASTIYKNGGIVSAVCHGVVGLINIKNEASDHLIKNKTVTGFTNTEEIAVGLDKVVPFLTEDELKRVGANYVKGADWKEFAVVDERIVTGQNPSSGGAVAEEVIKLLKGEK